MRVYVRVCLFSATTDRIKKTMRNHKQASSFSLHTPGLLFSLCFVFFFPLSNYSDDITQISRCESSQHRRQTHGKTFAGSGAMAARQVPPRTGKVLSQPEGPNRWDFGESPLFPAATGSPKYFILCFFTLCGPLSKHNLEFRAPLRTPRREGSGRKVYSPKGIN